ncbi:MAG: endonuclease III [Firmicutes bacterium]|nr:endonuclease III [Bacillota bacterium]
MKNSAITEQPRAQRILRLLQEKYPDAGCELDYSSGFTLLVAVILSAQCTDKRVNEVTAELFKTASDPQEFLDMGQAELERRIFPCGFYRQKAESILSASRDIIEKHGGRVPDDFDALIAMRGVGRKTANVVLSVAYHQSRIAVDTHVFRVSRRLGLSKGETPEAVERDLTAAFSGGGGATAHHVLIFHGRYCCKARKPECGECPVAAYCAATGANDE